MESRLLSVWASVVDWQSGVTSQTKQLQHFLSFTVFAVHVEEKEGTVGI